ncbi:MAG: type II toxin-antitoxin system RelB/DinJ family antitoxin [Synergistes sp.]|nr:type II toxin-antitoxin system RelB/DinJ family antitoxin [Synergistes sp.]
MSQSIMTARIDTEDKEEFETFCANVGMSVSAAVNLFVKAALRERRIPFEISDAGRGDCTKNTEQYMKAADALTIIMVELRNKVAHLGEESTSE